MFMISHIKAPLHLNLKKVAGMIAKLQKMIDEDAYCPDVVQQTNATIGLLKKVNELIIRDHVLCCGKRELWWSTKQAETFVDELIRITTIASK